MASAKVVETSVTNNSPSQDSNNPDDLFQSRYVTPGFKPFSYNNDIILQILVPQTHFYGHVYLTKILAMNPTQPK